jgi:putative aldouronate transport system substrate-binding protein
MKAGALGLGIAAIPGLSACTSGTPGESGSSGSVPTVELGSEVTSGGPTFPEGYLGPRITERKPFGDGSKTFRVVVPQDSTIVGDWNANKMTAWFEKFTGVKVQFDAVLMTAPDGTTDMTKINAMLAGGDLPDAFLGIPFTTAQLSLYGQQGLFVSMDDFLPLAPTLRQAMTDYPDLKKVVAATDGKLYTFPGVNDCFHCRSSPGRAWISQSYLDKVGMPVPGTTDELRQVLQAFKEKNPSGKSGFLPLAAGVGNPLDSWFMGAFGYNPVPSGTRDKGWMRLAGDKVEFVANTDQWRNVLIYLNQLGKDGTLTQSAFSMTSQELTQSGNNGKIGFARAYWWGSFYNPITLDANAPWRDYVAIPPVKGPDGTQIAGWDYYGFAANGLQITKNCTDPQTLVKWADYQMDLLAIMWGYAGVQDSNWAWSKSGEKGINDKQALYANKVWPAPAGQSWNQYSAMYRSNDFRLGERVNPKEPTFEAGLYQAGKSYEPFAQPKEQQLPPVIIDDADAAQAAETASAVYDHVNQSMAQFALGKLDPSNSGDWQKYVDTYNAMNLQNYLDIYQRAYDKAPK